MQLAVVRDVGSHDFHQALLGTLAKSHLHMCAPAVVATVHTQRRCVVVDRKYDMVTRLPCTNRPPSTPTEEIDAHYTALRLRRRVVATELAAFGHDHVSHWIDTPKAFQGFLSFGPL